MEIIKYNELFEKIKELDFKRYVAHIDNRNGLFYVFIEKENTLSYPETDYARAIFIVIEGKGVVHVEEEKEQRYEKGDILIIERKEKKKFFAEEDTIMVELRNISY